MKARLRQIPDRFGPTLVVELIDDDDEVISKGQGKGNIEHVILELRSMLNEQRQERPGEFPVFLDSDGSDREFYTPRQLEIVSRSLELYNLAYGPDFTSR